MNTTRFFIALILVTGSAYAGNGIEWLEPTRHDLITERLATDTTNIPASQHHETTSLTFAWPANGQRDAETTSPSVEVESRQYWMDVSGHALAHGVKLPLSAPGAVIRVSALEHNSALQLDPQQLELSINGQSYSRSAIEDMATGTELRDQGLSVPEDTLAFRMPHGSEAGTLEMRLPGGSDDLPMVVHVYEPQSPWVARLGAERQSFLAGQNIEFDLTLTDGEHEFSVDRVEAMMVNPDATETWKVDRSGTEGMLQGRIPDTALSPAPGLYEAHVYASHRVDGITVKRDLKLAFGVAAPVARFSGSVESVPGPDFGLSIGIEAATEGRYQVNGELYGTNELGQMAPLAFMQSAAVLDAGTGSISLEINAEALNANGLSAPFEIRNLQLLDQGRMYLLEERTRALRIGETQPDAPGELVER